MLKLFRHVGLGLFLILFLSLHSNAASIPDTGQVQCYNSTAEITCPQPGEPFYGQDANYIFHSPSYTKLDENGSDLPDDAPVWSTVRDNVTGLIWEAKQDGDGLENYDNPNDANNHYTWYDSNPTTNGGNVGVPGEGSDTEDFINVLNTFNLGGFSDWRLPTVMELNSIVDYSRNYPAINTNYFPLTGWRIWSSDTLSISTLYARIQSLEWGQIDAYPKGEQVVDIWAKAVRGGKWGLPGNLIANGDGTFTDTKTWLVWQQYPISTKLSWQQALSYCENLNLGGNFDWKLPNIKELISITNFTNKEYWSSTTVDASPERAFTGYTSSSWFPIGTQNKSDLMYIRAVRTGSSRSYCQSSLYTNGCTDGDDIGIVRFNTINNSTTGCLGGVEGYFDYTSHFSTVILGGTYTLEIGTSSDTWSQGFGVWIDFNQDGDFNDQDEFVYGSPGTASSPQTFITDVYIPPTALTGTTIMRVRGRYNNVVTATQSCNQFDYGETEDYALTIINPVPDLIPYAPDPTNDFTPTFEWIPVSGATSYRIQIDTDASFATPIIDTAISGAYSISRPINYIPTDNLPAGSIFWRVSSNLIYSLFSAIDDFSLQDLFTQQEIAQAVQDAIAPLYNPDGTSVVDGSKDLYTQAELDQIIVDMFTQAEVDIAILDERSRWDINGDNQISLEEAIHALQVVAGIRSFDTTTTTTTTSTTTSSTSTSTSTTMTSTTTSTTVTKTTSTTTTTTIFVGWQNSKADSSS